MDEQPEDPKTNPLVDAVDEVLAWFPDELPQHAVLPVGFMTALSNLRIAREGLETPQD